MASVSSFRDVIANMYYNEIFDELSEYIEDNSDKLESNSYHVQSPDEAALSDFDIITLDITDSPGNSILFDVIVSAEVEIAETVRRNRETDGIEQWFRISCRADLDDGIQNFQINSVSIYNKYRESKLGRLSEYLVPIIEKEQFDDVATDFLSEFCPEALSTPIPIPVDEVVKRMGLKVKEIQLTKHFTIFGQIVFGDCTIEYYDRNERAYKPLEVSRGTILVDPNVYFMRNIGCMNNTIIHECVHWYKHRKYHELVKTYNSDALLISCRVNETTKYKKQWTPEDWMEWHANGIAPRILMPKSMTIKKIEELIKKNELLFGNHDRLNIMENVVYELADFFQVSRIAAKMRELFQFDCADLNFGIYRIMNFKRAIIERFISEDLPRLVNDELNKGGLAAQSQATQELDAARKKVLEALGEDALDVDGNLAEKYRETKAGREYLVAQERARSAKGREALEMAIYNHLYSFFSRYWQDGDFISKRRYSKKERYAIPYNGEEVYLYWANQDQYYVKTGEYFTDYTWKAPHGVTVHFKLKTADVEQNNIKGEKRFFLPRLDQITWDANASTLTIPFEFRPLTQQEQNTYGQRNQQEAIIVETLEKIPKRLPKNAHEALAALIAEKRRTDGAAVTLLEHHLRQYTRRNTSDFFIHKDLKGFLSRELDFYLKNEVLNLEEMEAAGEGLAEGWFQLMRLIKRIGLIIIEFLAQIENFQKMLWEKKKFITETFYVITVGNIPETFYPEIAENEAQWEEWEKILAIDTLPQDLFSGNWRTPEGRMAFLKAHPSLPLDTRHFPLDFTDRLLASFDDLDEMTDGLLIHSENWQALNLLQEKYRERVKTIYIDPPYNTVATPILYKNDYKHSSWISLMADRCTLSSGFLGNAGILAAAIDDEEVLGLRYLLSMIFEQELGIAVVRSNPAGRKTKGKLAPAHEYLLLYGKTAEATPSFLDVTDERLKRFPLQDEYGNYAWANFIRSGSHDKREDRPKLFYPIFVSQNGHIRVPAIEWNEEKRSYDLLEQPLPGEQVVYPVVRQGGKIVEKNWQRGHERVRRELDRGWYRVRKHEDGSLSIDFKTYMDEQSLPTTWWDNKEHASANYGALELKSLFGEKPFDFSKSTALVRDSILASGGRREDSIILDYFAGSGTTGHAVINLNREDGGRRKFILVEMADYFDTVLLPRLKKVTFSPEWKDGKPKRVATVEEAERGPRIIKVIRLESYEDALNNLSFDESAGQLGLPFEDYLLKYMLQWETRKSETLLNVEKLSKPFDYCLHIYRDGETRVQKVDLPETFNYLIGLDVAKRQLLDDNGRYYLVYRGMTREGRCTVVIWRETEGWAEEDYKRDRDFVDKHKFAEDTNVIYVNGDSLIPGAQGKLRKYGGKKLEIYKLTLLR